ncbi:MAG: hypothetical protein IJ274_04130 [Lachnospiraceae bacterium]|nr:hypothetical protein [Lachnospiraceae bacterium]
MFEKVEWKSKIAYYSFYLAVIIEVLIVVIDKSSYTNPIEGRLFQLTFLLCFVKVCLTKYEVKEYITIFLFCTIGALSYFITGRNEILRLVMLVAACKNVDMKKCLKLVFWMTIVGCLVIVGLAVAGVYGTIALTQDYGRGSVETRYVLGMGHPNALQCMAWALTTLGLYLYAEKMKWYFFILIIAINGSLFLITDSKTGLFVAGFTIVMFVFVRIFKGKWVGHLIFFGGMIATISSIAMSIFAAKDAGLLYRFRWEWYWNPKVEFYRKLDAILTGRINSLTGTTRWEGTTKTWSLFSEPANNYYFDMGWVRLFYWYGIIPACIFIVVLILLMIYTWRKEKIEALIMIISFSVYTLIEAHGISEYLARNYVFFLLGAYWSPMLADFIGIFKRKDKKIAERIEA